MQKEQKTLFMIIHFINKKDQYKFVKSYFGYFKNIYNDLEIKTFKQLVYLIVM